MGLTEEQAAIVPQAIEATVLEFSAAYLTSPNGGCLGMAWSQRWKFHDRVAATLGEAMPTVVAHHDVKDKDHWLASPKREEVFGPLGVTNIRTFVDPQNPTRVAVLMDVADMDAVMGAMQTKEMADAMEYDGVLPETLVILVEA
jgi:hypothetical protein